MLSLQFCYPQAFLGHLINAEPPDWQISKENIYPMDEVECENEIKIKEVWLQMKRIEERI